MKCLLMCYCGCAWVLEWVWLIHTWLEGRQTSSGLPATYLSRIFFCKLKTSFSAQSSFSNLVSVVFPQCLILSLVFSQPLS